MSEADGAALLAKREREIAAMTAIAQATTKSLQRMHTQNEALQTQISALDTACAQLQVQV